MAWVYSSRSQKAIIDWVGGIFLPACMANGVEGHILALRAIDHRVADFCGAGELYRPQEQVSHEA